MNELLDLQNKFQNYLLDNDSAFKCCINGTEKISAGTRLAIYENAYQLRLIDALAANYPVLKDYLGCEQFNELGEAYLRKYPSTYRSIRWFGDKLALFLNENKSYNDMPYLAELAQFEWAMTLVFDASDASILTVEEVASIPPENWPDMRFQAHPSLRRLNLEWNVIGIWQSITQDEQPPEPVQFAEPISWVLWRKELMNQFCSIPVDEAWAIDAMLRGETFGEICEGLCQWVNENDAGLHAASLLKGWIQSGLLSHNYHKDT